MQFPALTPDERVPDHYPPYRSTLTRGPREQPIRVRDEHVALHGIELAHARVLERDADLTAQGSHAPIGQVITVSGRVCDEDGRPVAHSLIEIWQCNAAGRYAHARDDHDAPLDPNFLGHGRCLTDAQGCYRFRTIKPGAYPWGNHDNAWRPAHIHFSLFGRVYAQRLVTQMYFPEDPLLPFDPIFNAIPDAAARARLIARFSLEHSESGRSLGFVFDIVLRGRDATPMGR